MAFKFSVPRAHITYLMLLYLLYNITSIYECAILNQHIFLCCYVQFCTMFYEASYAKKLLAGLSYQAFQADSILRQQLLRIKKKGQASLRFNCAFLLSNSVAEKTKQAMLSRRRRCCRRQLSQCARPQPSCCRRRHVTVSVNRTQLTEK